MFQRLTDGEKALFEQIMPTVFADDATQLQKILDENLPANETLVERLVKRGALKTDEYIEASSLAIAPTSA